MRVASHKTLMCNKLCNWVFCLLYLKCPALDVWLGLDGQGASRLWTLVVPLTVKGVQTLDGNGTLTYWGASRILTLLVFTFDVPSSKSKYFKGSCCRSNTPGANAGLAFSWVRYLLHYGGRKHCVHAPAAFRSTASCFGHFHRTNIRLMADWAASWINVFHW